MIVAYYITRDWGVMTGKSFKDNAALNDLSQSALDPMRPSESIWIVPGTVGESTIDSFYRK